MIVVAIIAILVAIALPLYRAQLARGAESACLAEMKSYAGQSLAMIAAGDASKLVAAPLSACATADTATESALQITGVPKPPGARTISCDMPTSTCVLSD